MAHFAQLLETKSSLQGCKNEQLWGRTNHWVSALPGPKRTMAGPLISQSEPELLLTKTKTMEKKKKTFVHKIELT